MAASVRSISSSAESIITVGVVEEEKDNKMVLHLSVSICKDLLAEIKRAGRNCVAGRGEQVDAFWWKNACGDNIPGHVQRIASS